MAKSLLLTGHPGIGKTTLIRKVAAALGPRAGGFTTEEISGPGGRHGMRLITLDGKEAIFTHKDLHDNRHPSVGRYGVDVPALDRVGVRALRRALEEGKILIVDEIAMMTLLSPAFQEVLFAAIVGNGHVIGTMMARPHPEGDAFRNLAQVEIHEVDRRNRNDLPARVLAWVEKTIPPS
jgi:nucleoside-triphosphatase